MLSMFLELEDKVVQTYRTNLVQGYKKKTETKQKKKQQNIETKIIKSIGKQT